MYVFFMFYLYVSYCSGKDWDVISHLTVIRLQVVLRQTNKK